VRIARTFLGLGQAELGARLGVGRAIVAELETGARQASPELIRRMAALGFEAAFFEATLPDAPHQEECHGVRGLGPRRRALAHACLLAELVAWLDARVRLPSERLPHASAGDRVTSGDPLEIEAAAAQCRRLWGLAPDLPLPNLTRVVERAGIVVADGREGPAFARVGRRHMVVLDLGSSDRDGQRPPGDARLHLARLAGHVILHRGVGAGHDQDEGARRVLDAEADRFAGALLLPRDGLLRELPRAPSLDAAVLVPLARRWKVSLALLVRRAAELPIANASRYRDAAEHLSSARPRPLPMQESVDPEEAPEVVALALQRIEQGLRLPRVEVARRLGWSPRILADVAGFDVGSLDVKSLEGTKLAGPGKGSAVISLAAWRARVAGLPEPPSPSSHPAEAGHRPSGVQLDLDFGPSR
jgi:transcriptional regulator with XRE-family HTH domain